MGGITLVAVFLAVYLKTKNSKVFYINIYRATLYRASGKEVQKPTSYLSGLAGFLLPNEIQRGLLIMLARLLGCSRITFWVGYATTFTDFG